MTNSYTLYFYNNEPSKNNLFLILLSSLARSSQGPKLKRSFDILWVLFEKISVFNPDWPKSWIWRTFGHARDIFCKCHPHNASKGVFSQNFFEFHAWVQKCHFARIAKSTYQPFHGIQKDFLPEDVFWSTMKMQFT